MPRLRRVQFAAATVFALSAAVSSARAQATIGVGAGGAFPIGNSGNAYGTGYNISAFLGLNIPTLPIGVRFDGQYDRLPYKVGGGNADLGFGTINVVYQSPISIVTPYVIGGAGYYHLDTRAVVPTSSLGLNGGVGVKAPLHWGLGLFLEARYHYVFSHRPDTQLVPITLGVTF